nr:MAG TPA: hypothetical protein [Bacteriophage sp.]
MALTKPILNNVAAFDASNSQIFTFNVVGGSQVTANTLTIKDNSTLEQVYSATQTSFKLQHVVPAGTLTNGKYYQAYLVTIDAQGNTSAQSNTIQFNCYAQPVFRFTNVSEHAVVNNASFEFQAQYNQAQGEILNEYTFNLYNVAGLLVSTSGKQYNTSSTLPFNISHPFSGLGDNTAYSVEVVGRTSGGTSVTTGKVDFSVRYTSPTLYSPLYLTNNCQGGYITIETDINPITGQSNPTPPVYIDNKEVDLTADGSWIEWNEGYKLSSPYTVRIWGRAFKKNTTILTLKNKNGATVVLSTATDSDGYFWFELRATMQDWHYVYTIMSNKIAQPVDTDNLFIWLRADGDLYDLKIEVLT